MRLDKLLVRFGLKPKQRAFEEELSFHLEQQVQANIAAGMRAEDARRRALIAFGGVQQTRERVDEVRWTHSLETVVQDARYAARVLRNSSGFTAIAVLTLALGIGANTAIFSAVNATLFSRWPVRDQQQLVLVREPAAANQGYLISVPDFEDYRAQQSTFEQLSLWVGQTVNLTGREHPDRLVGAFVSANFFDMLGVKASLGRTFLAGEDKLGAAPVGVISYEAWQNRFGGKPDFVGQQIILNNEPYTVVGVLPRGFVLPVSPSDVFIPVQHYPDYKEDRTRKSFLIFGRIKEGVGISQATADLNAIAQRLAREYPKENTGIHVEINRLHELSTRTVRTPLLVLLAAVAMVLLIVCANIANLLLARGAARRREVALRAALGASRGRIVRQFLSESMILACAGGLGGVLLAYLLLRWLLKISPVQLPAANHAVFDVRVLFFTLAVSFVTGLLAGVAPALQFSRTSASLALASEDRVSGSGWQASLRSVFVVGQLAICLALLVDAGLLVRSFQALLNTNPGFEPGHLLTMEYRLPANKYVTMESQLNFHRQMLSRVQRVPGVSSAAILVVLPFSGNWAQVSFDLPSGPLAEDRNGFSSLVNLVSPEYFSTMGVPLLAGREFSAHDDYQSPPVALISQSFAQKFFPGRNPIGNVVRIRDTDELAFGKDGAQKRAVIVGIVGNVRQKTVRDAVEPQIYFPFAQSPGIFGTLVVRTALNPTGLSDAVRQAIWSVDKEQPVWKVRTMDFLLQKDTAPDRFVMLLMSALGLLALGLSALGTYAMLSNAVTQRTREMGIRMALGAARQDILSLVLCQGFKLVLIGAALGLAAAMISSHLLSNLLYGVGPGDLTSFALGLGVLGAVALFACWLPARRATRVDPLVALRYE